jgi:hypothetical protein
MLKLKYLISLLWLVSFPMMVLQAQESAIPIQCGDIIEAELTAADFTSDNRYTIHEYTVSFNAGDSVTVRAEPIGSFLDIGVHIKDTQDVILENDSNSNGNTSQIDVVLSASGQYIITIYGASDGKIGAYQAFFGCTLRDGSVIAPGDVVATPEQNPTDLPDVPSFSGFGFPGLQPVDFSQGVTIPLTLGTPNTGSISDGFVGIFGFTFSANAGDVIDLSFERLSGNLNLGLAVLSEQNEIAFQASLVTSSTLSTRFTLPSTGEYTIGVFRIELLPPDAPEATTFQITGTINP